MSSDKEIRVRDYYNRFAEHYDHMYEEIQLKKFQFLLIEIKDRIFDCIDLGGGTGLLSNFLRYPIITLDISFDMLLHGLNLERLFLPICGDLSYLPIRQNSFNFAISVTAFQNSSNFNLSFKELIRILNYGKNAIITMLSKKIETSYVNQILDDLNLFYEIFSLPVEDIGFLITK